MITAAALYHGNLESEFPFSYLDSPEKAEQVSRDPRFGIRVFLLLGGFA